MSAVVFNLIVKEVTRVVEVYETLSGEHTLICSAQTAQMQTNGVHVPKTCRTE